MAWESVTELDNVLQMEVGQIIEGKFLRVFEHVKKDGELMNVYEFEANEGHKFQLLGCGSLKYQFEKISEGDRVQLEYFGKVPSNDPKKNDFHSYKVQKWIE